MGHGTVFVLSESGERLEEEVVELILYRTCGEFEMSIDYAFDRGDDSCSPRSRMASDMADVYENTPKETTSLMWWHPMYVAHVRTVDPGNYEVRTEQIDTWKMPEFLRKHGSSFVHSMHVHV